MSFKEHLDALTACRARKTLIFRLFSKAIFVAIPATVHLHANKYKRLGTGLRTLNQYINIRSTVRNWTLTNLSLYNRRTETASNLAEYGVSWPRLVHSPTIMTMPVYGDAGEKFGFGWVTAGRSLIQIGPRSRQYIEGVSSPHR